MNRSRSALGVAACVALLSATWLVKSSHALLADTPIIVSDGSIVIQSPGVNLADWQPQGNARLDHPDSGKTMRTITVTGPNAVSGTNCEGKSKCTIEVTWSTGQGIRIVAKNNDNRGVQLEAINAPFDNAGWNKSSAQSWRFTLPAGAVPTITLRGQGNNNTPQTVCRGAGCSVSVSYQ